MMRLIQLIIAGLVVMSISCRNNLTKNENQSIKTIAIDQRNQGFENLISIANCKGPKGNYVTEVHSSKDRYTYFKQQYDYSNEDFAALILNEKEGYIINNEEEKLDTLPREVIEMIRTHEFHKLQLYPDQYFENLKFNEETHYQGKLCEEYLGNDLLKNPVSLYYDRGQQLIRGIELLNPVDTTEGIQIVYKGWENSELGKLVKRLEIIQDEKDTFQFEYETILINEEDFKKRG